MNHDLQPITKKKETVTGKLTSVGSSTVLGLQTNAFIVTFTRTANVFPFVFA